MRRRLLTIAIFLLAGAVVNVAVAWSYPLWPDPNQWQATQVDAADDFWHEVTPAGWPPCRSEGKRLHTAILTVDMRYSDAFTKEPALGRYASGFPLRCVKSYVLFEGANNSSRSAHHGVMLGRAPFAVLGLSPLWIGFTINTLFYAGVLWLLIPGPFAFRRLIRRRRGLCPACGHDLRHGEHQACPECGVAA